MTFKESKFTEETAVENLVRDLLTQGHAGAPAWRYVSGAELERTNEDVLVKSDLIRALDRLNPEIEGNSARSDEVLYALQAILVGASTSGLVGANEEFRSWLVGEKSMPFGEGGQHKTVRLIDFENPSNNDFIAAQQVTFTQGSITVRFDLVLYVNGMPLVVVEAKTPSRPAVTWLDGASQVHDDYERNVPRFFVPNAFSVATDGKDLRYGTIACPTHLWGPWREEEDYLPSLSEVAKSVVGLLDQSTLLDLVKSFTIYSTDKQHRKIKIISRYQQYEGANRIVERVLDGRIKKGLIWHFQGSGKSLLMVFASQKLRLHPDLENPTVLIVVDRIDLDTQITSTFNAADVPNMISTESRQEIEKLLSNDMRKVVITTIHKFAEVEGVLNDRDNIIVLADEAHRTQEGDLGLRMREALPNAFLFGLTGTPINKRDKNTFKAFGAAEDEHGYLSLYSFSDSVRDQATLPLRFEGRLLEMRVDQEEIDRGFEKVAEGLSDEDKQTLADNVAKLGVLVKAPKRIAAVAADIANHFSEHVEPNGFKAQLVTFDREACVLYKDRLDEILGPDVSEVVMDTGHGTPQDWKQRFGRSRDEEEALLDRFRDEADPFKILIVTSKLLTGFDAPILQTMYLDKPLRDHTLLQAICRTNRPYPSKSQGLIVDYIGIFDDVAQSLSFDDASMRQVVTNAEELKDAFPVAMDECLNYFQGVDRSVEGYEGLMAAQECLPDNDTRDSFAAAYSFLQRHWEALSPDAFLIPFRSDYIWLSQVYESVQPPSGKGKLVWHSHGAKTLELIAENTGVDDIHWHPPLDLDAEVLDELVGSSEPDKTAKVLEITVSQRLRSHGSKPEFIALGERLESLRERHEQGQLLSLEYLKELTDLAKDVVAAEQAEEPEEDQMVGKAKLTELFEETRTPETPVIVERIVTSIDEIVERVRFPDWQDTIEGERTVKQALRKALLQYKLHRDEDLFDRAYGYIKQYY